MNVVDLFVKDVRDFVKKQRISAYASVASSMLETYWGIGQRIIEHEQQGKLRAKYGENVIDQLATRLVEEFGTGFSAKNLRNFRKFYQYFPKKEIWNACVPNLNWTHFRCLLRVEDETARLWYMKSSFDEGWSTRVLDRNIATQSFYRLVHSPNKDEIVDNLQKKEIGVHSGMDLVKSPVIAEFLGFKNEDSYIETELESAILSHIRDFLMELGKGFAFVARQQHIVTDTQDYFIDLVFYNIVLKCYFLIDLKMGTVSHQDVGQMDMYMRMYDELKCGEGDNPTIGLLLCSETSEDIARYSILHDNDKIFMAKYLAYMPTKEQLKQEIEKQKEIFYAQHPSQRIALEKDGV